MADISKVKLNNSTYNLKDRSGREQLVSIQSDVNTIYHPNNRFEEKSLGTWSSISDVDSFFNTYNADMGWDGLSLGNYVSVANSFGTNDWMIAGFETYYNIGTCRTKGITFIPKTYLNVNNTHSFTMNDSATTNGGYNGTYMNSTRLVDLASQVGGVIGTHLKSINILVSSGVNGSQSRIDGLTGAANNCGWIDRYLVIPSELQIYGSSIWGNSFDTGESIAQLPVFAFISPNEYDRQDFWVRAVASSTDFAYASQSGDCWHSAANIGRALRPIMYLA